MKPIDLLLNGRTEITRTAKKSTDIHLSYRMATMVFFHLDLSEKKNLFYFRIIFLSIYTSAYIGTLLFHSNSV